MAAAAPDLDSMDLKDMVKHLLREQQQLRAQVNESAARSKAPMVDATPVAPVGWNWVFTSVLWMVYITSMLYNHAIAAWLLVKRDSDGDTWTGVASTGLAINGVGLLGWIVSALAVALSKKCCPTRNEGSSYWAPIDVQVAHLHTHGKHLLMVFAFLSIFWSVLLARIDDWWAHFKSIPAADVAEFLRSDQRWLEITVLLTVTTFFASFYMLNTIVHRYWTASIIRDMKSTPLTSLDGAVIRLLQKSFSQEPMDESDMDDAIAFSKAWKESCRGGDCSDAKCTTDACMAKRAGVPLAQFTAEHQA